VKDLYPVHLEIKDLYCFKGDTIIDLDRNVYAIVAHDETNPLRSNWLGKSTLMMSIAFALMGWHTKRVDDEIITHGQREASVSLRLNDGSLIERSKVRGKSMQVRFTDPGGNLYTQTRADEEIAKHIGLSASDFFATFFFRQGQLGALVDTSSSSSDKLEIIEGWLAEELESVQRVHVVASKHYAQVTDDLAKCRNEFDRLFAELDDLANLGEQVALEKTDFEIDFATNRVAELKREYAEALIEVEKEKQREVTRKRAARFEQVIQSGVTLKGELDSFPEGLEEAFESIKIELVGVRKEYSDLSSQLREFGNRKHFLGVCPVVEKPCPSADWVDVELGSFERRAKVEATLQATENRFRDLEAKAKELEHKIKRKRWIETELVRLRAQASDLQADAEAAEQLPEEDRLTPDLSGLEREIEELTNQILVLKSSKKKISDAFDAQSKLTIKIAELEESVKLARSAVQLTGKTGAQQAIQELALAQIEIAANQLLLSIGVDLKVSVNWSRESKGLAKVCGECGTAFPTSQRVKVCGVCNAERGPNVTQKLNIELSNRSGAAETLAGIALGISTAKWIKSHRGSRWSSVFIDEPFGMLDEYHRQSLCAQITGMLSTSFCSAFVVAHDRASQSAMPGRIEIVSKSGYSTVERVV
jgi:DNA repair exonuclease SbcCD ATPase subunit